MYAIVNIAGQQMKVAKDQQVYVNRLPGKEGDKVTFDEVLLVDNDGKVSVGAPAVTGASVSAKVIEHLKGDKVIVFKKKRRKGYQTRNGHRQLLTKIAIDGISLDGAKKASKAEDKPKAEAKPKTEAKSSAKADDLTKVEGIGPKIAELLNSSGIKSYKDLANTSVEKLNELLSEEGGAYASHNPETWPEQAQLAADGKFDELKEWQDKLEGGVDK
ncbi:MAG TPA: 50S ribosomal protein L21 [Cryomorphaceae bacterium]|nr:50S ribosomal protein L21 [Cryomorphaceae bacterium]